MDAADSNASSVVAQNYDEKYRDGQYFSYKDWVYKPFVRALREKAGLKSGATLLDAGCGQGYFSNLFAEQGLQVTGVDLSAEGIRSAREVHSGSGATFQVGDIQALTFGPIFDCVFSRSCSLYNEASFSKRSDVTDALLGYVKPGGMFIFDYYTKLDGKQPSATWRYHTMEAVREHFGRFAGSEVYFSLRVTAGVLGRFCLTQSVSKFDQAISRLLGLGGDALAFVRKRDTSQA